MANVVKFFQNVNSALAGMFYDLRFHLEFGVLICYDARVIHMYQYM